MIAIASSKLSIPIIASLVLICGGVFFLNSKNFWLSFHKNDVFLVSQTINSESSSNTAVEFTTEPLYIDKDGKKQRNYQCVITVETPKKVVIDDPDGGVSSSKADGVSDASVDKQVADAPTSPPAQEDQSQSDSSTPPTTLEYKENCKLHKITVDTNNKKWMYADEIKINGEAPSETTQPNLVAKYQDKNLLPTIEEEDTKIKLEELKAKDQFYLVQMSYKTWIKFAWTNTIKIKSFSGDSPALFGSLKQLLSIYDKVAYSGLTEYLVGKSVSVSENNTDPEKNEVSFSDDDTIQCKLGKDVLGCSIYDFGNSTDTTPNNYTKPTTKATTIKKNNFYVVKLEEPDKFRKKSQHKSIIVQTTRNTDPKVVKETKLTFSQGVVTILHTDPNDEFLFVMKKLPQ